MNDDDKKNVPNEDNKLPTHPMSTSDPPFRDLVSSDNFNNSPVTKQIKSGTHKKLELLDSIYHVLKDKANEVLEEAEESLKLHQIKIYARKQCGKRYYLYQKAFSCHTSNNKWFSILAPEEYKSVNPSANFLGCYILDFDNTWKKYVEE